MTRDERLEVEEQMEIIGKSLNRVTREFNMLKKTVDRMRLTVDQEMPAVEAKKEE